MAVLFVHDGRNVPQRRRVVRAVEQPALTAAEGAEVGLDVENMGFPLLKHPLKRQLLGRRIAVHRLLITPITATGWTAAMGVGRGLGLGVTHGCSNPSHGPSRMAPIGIPKVLAERVLAGDRQAARRHLVGMPVGLVGRCDGQQGHGAYRPELSAVPRTLNGATAGMGGRCGATYLYNRIETRALLRA